MKSFRYRFVTGALLICWMLIIYWFSAQPAAESEQMSGTVSAHFIESFEEIFDLDLTEEEIQMWMQWLSFPVRKGAHMAEYVVCAILASFCVLGYREWNQKASLIAFGITVGGATVDEIHQLFVPGRAGLFSDVCIDGIGAVMGLLLFGIVLKNMDKHCEK